MSICYDKLFHAAGVFDELLRTSKRRGERLTRPRSELTIKAVSEQTSGESEVTQRSVQPSQPANESASSGQFEVLTMGRVSADIYPLEIGVPLEDVQRFGKFLGGSPTNVAVAAARHGRRCAVITRTGDDPFGRFVHKAMRELGVDDRFVRAVPGLATPVAFCEIFPPDNFPLYFYREPKAPDLEIRVEELDLDAIRNCGIFWTSVTGLSQEPSRSSHAVAMAWRGRRKHTILDLDYRAVFWSSIAATRREIEAVLGQATVVIGNLDEVEAAVGTRNAHDAAKALLGAGVELAIVKRGSLGALAMTANETVEVPAVNIAVMNGLGAGDGFGGAICHGLLSGWPLERMLRFANAAGAIVASRLECSTAMPTTDEVLSLLDEHYD
jgi:5-dehydro-2-deoxygluconokinase